MSFVSQGNRPNYQSSIQPLSYPAQPYETSDHEHYIGAAVSDLSTITELDFEQPRQLWDKVFDESAKERFVQNVKGHLGGVTVDEIVVKTLAILYVLLPLLLSLSPRVIELMNEFLDYSGAISGELGDRIAKALKHELVAPLKVAPASSGRKFRARVHLRNPVTKEDWAEVM